VVLVERIDAVAVITLNRPEVRNALNGDLRSGLWAAMLAENDGDAAAIVLTGADPAFCAGLDLKALASDGLAGTAPPSSSPAASSSSSSSASSQASAEAGSGSLGSPIPALDKPLIGAINGVAVTGGLELALACDFLIGSERARFADTHARVGVMPGWGLTVALPQTIGIRRARQMSFTGNYVDAEQALEWGLLNEIVSHDSLVERAVSLGNDMGSIPPTSLAGIAQAYRVAAATHDDQARAAELDFSNEWARSFDPAVFATQREAIQARGKSQQS